MEIIEMNFGSKFLSIRKILSIGLIYIILNFFAVQIKTGLAAVTLIDFTVTYEENQVKLNWNTASEPDNALFFIERKDTESGNYQRISVFNPEINSETDSIPPKGASVSGGSYTVYDKHVVKGVNYSYRLVAVDLSNHLYYISPTSIKNPPPTSTPTATATKRISTPRKTKSSSNTSNNTPSPPTATYHLVSRTVTTQPTNLAPSPTALLNTPTSSEAVLAIPTLALPSVTLIFPATPTPQTEFTITPAAGTLPDNASWFTPQRITVIGLIVSIWVILGGGFFLVLKKIE